MWPRYEDEPVKDGEGDADLPRRIDHAFALGQKN